MSHDPQAAFANPGGVNTLSPRMAAVPASPSPIPCPLCGRPARPAHEPLAWPLREGGRVFRYGECDGCQLMFAEPQPTPEELEWLYTHRYDYEWFRKRRSLKRLQARHRWSRLRSLLARHGGAPGRRLLDVGGGHNWFLRAARRDGWEATGLELLSDELARTAAALGVEMQHGTLTAHSLGSRTFDVVTIWHALEHMSDPRAAFAGAAALVAPGGFCVVAVPNFQCAGYARAGADWVWCQKPFIHPWHFSARSLQSLLPADLEAVEVTTRDTWDGQVFDTTAAWRAMMRLIYLGWRVPAKAARALGLRTVERGCDQAQFLTEEALRLATYAGYIALRPLLRSSYENAMRGSELLLLARKRK